MSQQLNNGWLPIEMFRQDTFPDEEPFLIWLIDNLGHEFWEVARYGTDNGEQDGPRRITGEWRRYPVTGALEPVAYQAGPRGPNDLEARVSEASGLAIIGDVTISGKIDEARP